MATPSNRQKLPGRYGPPAYASYGVVPLLFGIGAGLAVGLVGVVDRIPWMRRLPNPIPWTDVAGYAAIAFVTVYAVLVIKALIWPWEQ